MTTVMSAIGEATGMKPDDKVIGLGLMAAAASKAQGYLTAALTTTTPELRHVMLTHLQDALNEHEQVTRLAIKKGWFQPHLPVDQLIRESAAFAQPMMQ
ncbi:MAG: spore coat protein [Bacillota bacterium]